MTHSLGRLAAVTATLAVLSSVLAGCGLLDGSSPVEDALEYLPADATTVLFVDRHAMDERLELDDISTGASEDELATWAEAQQDEGYGTELSAWVTVMQAAAFSDLDVAWEASGTSAGEGRVTVWRLHDDVDFDEVRDDLLDAGYERREVSDVDTFEARPDDADESGLYGGRYPATLTSLALVPDEHLVLSGAVELAIDVANDDEDSLSDEGSFADLLDRAPDAGDLEYAGMTIEPACGAGIALFAGPDALTAVRLLGDDADAADDAEALGSRLEEQGAATGFDVDLDVQADGEAVTAEASFDDRRPMTQAWNRLDGPFACPPQD